MKKVLSRNPLDWVEILKVLADETRLQVIRELMKGEASVNKLSRALGIETYNASKHLKILETCGLIEKRKDGTRRIYRIKSYLKRHLSDNSRILDLGCCKFNLKDLK